MNDTLYSHEMGNMWLFNPNTREWRQVRKSIDHAIFLALAKRCRWLIAYGKVTE